MLRFAVLMLLAIAPLCSAADDPLTKYFIAFLHKGPKFTLLPEDSPERKLNHERHVAYIEQMRASGKMLVFGPILDGGDLRGIYVFKAASLEEAREWANQEPSVKIGMIEMKVYAWLAPSSLAGAPR